MIVFSLFDGSGIAGYDYAKAGHTVYCFNADEGNHGEYFVKMQHPNLHYVNLWIDKSFDEKRVEMGLPVPDIMFAYPDCTFFAQSGDQHVRTEQEMQLARSNVDLIPRLGDLYGCPWYLENPVGKLSTEWRKPDYYFHPYEYGGYLSPEEGSFHPKMPVCDGYTKKTCIWAGNGFKMPAKKPVDHCGFFWGWKYLGGKSARTKQLRSLTPRGFARAVFLENS